MTLAFWAGVLAVKLVVMNGLVFVYGKRREAWILALTTVVSILLWGVCYTHGL